MLDSSQEIVKVIEIAVDVRLQNLTIQMASEI